MPSCVPSKQKQLRTEQANRSRFITKCRWTVEAVNGLMKTYRAHDKVVQNKSLPHAIDDFRISASLINRFHKRLISDNDNSLTIINEMKAKLTQENELESFVEKNNFDRKRVSFKKLDANEVTDFPRLDIETIKTKITLGTYQLKQSLSYLAEHQKENGNYTIEVFTDKNKALGNYTLLRSRIQSRHSGTTKHNSYVTYESGKNTANSIKSWFCTCKNGKRTVGCCSHIASTVFYLSYGRYNNFTEPAASLQNIFPSAVIEESSEDEESEETQPPTSGTSGKTTRMYPELSEMEDL